MASQTRINALCSSGRKAGLQRVSSSRNGRGAPPYRNHQRRDESFTQGWPPMASYLCSPRGLRHHGNGRPGASFSIAWGGDAAVRKFRQLGKRHISATLVLHAIRASAALSHSIPQLQHRGVGSYTPVHPISCILHHVVFAGFAHQG